VPGYTAVNLPEEIVERIDEFIENEGQDWGYRSRPDVIKDAVRRFLETRPEVYDTASSRETENTEGGREVER